MSLALSTCFFCFIGVIYKARYHGILKRRMDIVTRTQITKVEINVFEVHESLFLSDFSADYV